MTVTSIGNMVIFDDGKRKQSFPVGTVILTSDEGSDAVNVKGVASRRTLISFNCKEAGYETAKEAVEALSEILN